MNLAAGPQTIEVAGRRLAWRSVGRGPALLLVNGYAATGADWDPEMVSTFAQSFEVICPDNRGTGDSELGDPAELTIDGMASDLESLLDALKIERAPVVGWSMGGFVAQRLAARAPQRVQAMVLLASDPGGSAAVLAEPEIWALLIDHSGTPRTRATRLISLLFPSAVAPEVDRQFGELVAAAQAQLSLASLHAQEAAIAAWHAHDQPPSKRDPPRVLAVCGSSDIIIPPANAHAIAAHWPGAGSECFPGGGHGFMAQEPVRLADLVMAFLREDPARVR